MSKQTSATPPADQPTGVAAGVCRSPRSLSRWPLLGFLAWMGAVVCGAGVVFGAVWRDDLQDATGVVLLAHWCAFMCQTFSWHMGLACVVSAIGAIVMRRRRLLVLSVLVCLAAMGPWALQRVARGAEGPAGEAPGDGLTIMSVNLMFGRVDVDALARQIERENPDVIAFQEWTPRASAALREKLKGRWEHMVEEPREGAFGQCVCSRLVFVEPVQMFPPTQVFEDPQIGVSVEVGGRVMRIRNVHLTPPGQPWMFRAQRRQAGALAAWCADAARDDQPQVFIGDFNSTQRAGVVRRLLDAGYVDAHGAAGIGSGATWPHGDGLGVLGMLPGVRIDQALVGRGAVCEWARVGEEFGSDHRPVVVRVRWGKP